MYEDRQCDENFYVESSAEFLNGLDGEELDFLYHNSGMKICPNCGEFVSKGNFTNNVCNLCNKSEDHLYYRGSNQQVSSNYKANIDYIKEFNDR